MTWIDFGVRLVIAFILGVGIGIERQWLKTISVLKTNVLVRAISFSTSIFCAVTRMSYFKTQSLDIIRAEST